MATTCQRCNHSASLLARQWISNFSSTSIIPTIRSQVFRQCPSRTSPHNHTIIRSYTVSRASSKVRKPPARSAQSPPPAQAYKEAHRSAPSLTTSPAPGYDEQVFTNKLITKGSPTLLYISTKSNSGWLFRVLSSSGAFIFVALEARDRVFIPNPGIPWFVPYIDSWWLALIGGFALWSMPIWGRGSIGSITAKPVGGQLKLVIQSRPGPRLLGLQFWRSETVEVAVSDVKKAPSSMLQQHLPASLQERKELYEKERKTKTKVREWTIDKFNNNVLRQKNMGLTITETSSRGKKSNGKWDMDVLDGWMLDNGKALEQLFKEQKVPRNKRFS